MSRPLLQAEGLLKRYPGLDRPAVNDISLCLMQGEILGLLGPNGAGKTTTISMLSGLLRPDGGTVRINGREVLSHARSVRQMIGLVPQELALYPSLTLRENLLFLGRLYGLSGSRLQERLTACCGMTGLLEVLNRPVDQLSGGMKRRANLAAGILHEPVLLFLDEPTVGVDAQSRHLIFDHLRQLREQGLGMLYTTHYMEEVHHLCQRVVIIDEGRIVAQGAVAELLEQQGCQQLEELYLSLTGKALRD
ncbi:MAG: ABC transporter ATP-binding protein [Desulfuromonadaceae bacterium]|nr:ABC transporter ATP-binding protein [Desulfuromonadaceae bacterium]